MNITEEIVAHSQEPPAVWSAAKQQFNVTTSTERAMVPQSLACGTWLQLSTSDQSFVANPKGARRAGGPEERASYDGASCPTDPGNELPGPAKFTRCLDGWNVP
jgi:hypothetical protein